MDGVYATPIRWRPLRIKMIFIKKTIFRNKIWVWKASTIQTYFIIIPKPTGRKKSKTNQKWNKLKIMLKINRKWAPLILGMYKILMSTRWKVCRNFLKFKRCRVPSIHTRSWNQMNKVTILWELTYVKTKKTKMMSYRR